MPFNQIKEVLPLEEYLKKAEDYDEYGAYMGNYMDDLDDDSGIDRCAIRGTLFSLAVVTWHWHLVLSQLHVT